MADNNNLKMVMIIIVLVVLIAAGTSFAFLKILSPTSVNSAEEIRKNEGIGLTYQLGDFTVNLTNSGGYKFVRTSIVVEIDGEDVSEELEKRKPQLRDIIISTLRAQDIEIIEEPGGNALKELIKSKINNVLSEGKIISVWFTDFVVQ